MFASDGVMPSERKGGPAPAGKAAMRIASQLVIGASLVMTTMASAQSFGSYGSYTDTINLPTIGNYSVVMDAFPPGSPSMGAYDLEGRLLIANDQTLSIQKNFGEGVWLPVASTSGTTMDPSFIKISPDGSLIALGLGYGKKLIVFETSPNFPRLCTQVSA